MSQNQTKPNHIYSLINPNSDEIFIILLNYYSDEEDTYALSLIESH